jgi:hyperosmotically inducible protein
MKNMKTKLAVLIAVVTLATSTALATEPTGSEAENARLIKRVRKELVTLPFYGVFDNLSFKLDGDTVTLYGQTVRPSTRSDAEQRVAKIEGVERVINNIEVLPLSRFDDSIRLRTYRAIFRAAGLYRYSLGADPSLHIIVNRGHVTLEGVVANKMDSRLAYLAANQVSGVFSVTNNLRLERE